MEMHIHLDFLRWFVYQPYNAPLNGVVKINSNAICVAQDLRYLLVQTDHEAALLPARPFSHEMEAHHTLAHSGNPRYHRRAADEVSSVGELVQPRHSCRDARIRVG